jgi:pimeloyl-ACP methyl ester carboxylesterase
VIEFDLELAGGRKLHVYDTGLDSENSTSVFWHHGTPNIGAPPRPLFAVSDQLGVRWISHDRPGYGDSTPMPGRTVGSAAADVAAIADALHIQRFTVMGHSGGGPHALACAALLPDRVLAAVAVSSLAPYGAEGLDWFAGMAESAAATLSAALRGRAAKEQYEASAPDAEPGFTAADDAALSGQWSWFIDVVRPALTAGPGPLIDNDLAYVAPWASIQPRSPRRSFSCTAATTGWRHVPTPNGSRADARRPNSGCARGKGTFRLCQAPRPRCAGSSFARSIDDWPLTLLPSGCPALGCLPGAGGSRRSGSPTPQGM